MVPHDLFSGKPRDRASDNLPECANGPIDAQVVRRRYPVGHRHGSLEAVTEVVEHHFQRLFHLGERLGGHFHVQQRFGHDG